MLHYQILKRLESSIILQDSLEVKMKEVCFITKVEILSPTFINLFLVTLFSNREENNSVLKNTSPSNWRQPQRDKDFADLLQLKNPRFHSLFLGGIDSAQTLARRDSCICPLPWNIQGILQRRLKKQSYERQDTFNIPFLIELKFT